jgi:hypothetical protein
MAFLANALRVMIASAGDVTGEQDIVTGEIYRWNEAHSISRKLILLPMRWENSGAAQNSAPSQAAINWQTLEQADIIIGIFGTRIETVPVAYIGTTVEEIKRHIGVGKTATVYFYDAPLQLSQIDAAQYQALRTFREECRAGGFSATYNNLDAFKASFRQHLSVELNQPRYRWLPEPARPQQGAELPLTAQARRVLLTAARAQGVISTIPAAGGEVIHVGGERVSDGTARTTAILKEVFQDLHTRGLIEPTGSKQGNYRVTAPGYRAADRLVEEDEEKKKQLESEQKIAGKQEATTLRVASSQSTRL